nr:sulfotransferase domain-containing protein [Pseudenhygromyxa sp. WMMC2535]
MSWREGDIVISVPPKSGTTWMMNIVHQLRTGGDGEFEDIYVEVPWLELVEGPGQTREERLRRWDALPRERRRAFKTHAAPPMVPYVAPDAGGPAVQYVVVMRSPEEAAVSMRPFLASHTQAFHELWGMDEMHYDSFATFFTEIVEGIGLGRAFFEFLASWWPLRDQPNVELIHFSALKRDPEGTIRSLAEKLGFSLDAAQWRRVLEHVSFAWMKANHRKFDMQDVAQVPILKAGGMVRKGQVGKAHEEGMTEAFAARLRAFSEGIIDDPVALSWLYGGGATTS